MLRRREFEYPGQPSKATTGETSCDGGETVALTQRQEADAQIFRESDVLD